MDERAEDRGRVRRPRLLAPRPGDRGARRGLIHPCQRLAPER